MTIRICDRCGAITLDDEGCICSTPFDLSEIRRRHRAALESAHRRTGHPPTDEQAAPRHRTAAAAVSGERAQARVADNDSTSRPDGRASDARTDAVRPRRGNTDHR